MLKRIESKSEKQLLTLLIVFAIASRLIVLIMYPGITISGDSEDYIRLAKTITNFNLDHFQGRRTPGYSLLIGFTNNTLALVILIQVILGLLNIWLIFKWIKMLSNKNIAFLSVLFYSLFTHVLFYEFSILTENITTFFLILSVWFLIHFKLFETETKLSKHLVFGLILSYLYLIKPMFIYIPLGYFFFYILKNWHKNIKRSFFKPLSTIVICAMVYIGWNAFNKTQIGYFTNTQYFGINLAQTTTPFFEKAPNKDQLIRDIIVKHRDSILKKEPKAEAMTVWFAHKELKKKTNLSDLELSNKLGGISKDLITKHPTLYLKQAFKSWYLFWSKPHIYWKTHNFSSPYLTYANTLLWFFFLGYFVVIFNVLFNLFFIKKLIDFIKNKRIIFDITFFISSIVIVGSIAQALVAYGNNSRFCVPFLPLIIYVVTLNIFKFTTSNTKQ